jgi:hypothetical protein
MQSPTPQQKLELAGKISQLMDEYFAENEVIPDDDVLVMVLTARVEPGKRRYLLGLAN